MRREGRYPREVLMVWLIGAVLVFCNRAALAQSQSPKGQHQAIKLTSQTIKLPFGDRVFQGDEAAKLVNSRCLLCHSTGMVDTQPPLPVTAWRTEVIKMRSAYGCPLRDDQIDQIVKFVSHTIH